MRGVALVVLAACRFPEPSDRLPCGPGSTCTEGLVCLEQLCVPEPSTCARAVTAGYQHTCALRDDGTAWCWGVNTFGQLGDGTNEDRTSPVEVASTMQFTAIAAGSQNTCAIGADTAVWCWGRDQLGTRGDSARPVNVLGLTGIAAIAVGASHSCAVFDDGTVRCWGEDDVGQLGGTNLAPVPDLGNVTTLAAREDTTCAIHDRGDTRGILSCWGRNTSKQIDDGPGMHASPVRVAVPEPVTHIALGDAFLCAVTASGAVYCNGDDLYGQIAGPVATVGTPTRIELPVSIELITAGARFACAVERRDDRHDPPRAWCWGDNFDSQLTDDLTQIVQRPVPTAYANAIAMAGGRAHLCALSAAGSITCTGYNHRGQLGDGQRTTRGAPTSPIPGLGNVTALDAGGEHTCAITSGDVVCWGANDRGQLGDGSLQRRSRPTRVEGVERAVAIATGGAHSCALLADSTAVCWGDNGRGQLGNGRIGSDPTVRPVVDSQGAKLANITRLAAGGAHTCAMIEGRALVCWGDHGFGQLGPRSCANRICESADIALPMPARELALGFLHTCALLLDGTVPCWGDNTYGQLGDGTRMGRNTPELVKIAPSSADLTGVEHISARGHFTCAIASGTVRCWGAGEARQLGDGSAQDRSMPGPTVNNVTGASKIASGGDHACALAAAGLQCWGSNDLGEVGDDSYDFVSQPASISLGGATAVDLVGGVNHTCALLADGTVTCWGDGRTGQLGDGAFDKLAPVAPRLPCP